MRKFLLFRLRWAARRLQTILKEISASRPLPAGVAPQRFAESKFIRELVSSGFVDSLDKNR